jgi:hypothetical protein
MVVIGDWVATALPVARRRSAVAQWVCCTLVLLTAWCSDASAAAIGMPDQTARVGLMAGAMMPSIDASADGASADGNVLPTAAIVYTDRLSARLRYWAEAYYQQAGQEATTSEIGQNIAQLGARLSLQRRVPAVLGWRPWLGVGLDLSQVRYTDRHRVDAGGFLSRSYADRTEFQPALLFNLVTEWNLTRQWDVIGRLEHMTPLQDGIGGLSLSLGAVFTY